MSDEHLAATDVAELNADAVAVRAALQLGRQPWWTLSAALHALLLSVLCDDIVQGTRLRADVNVRFEEISALHVRYICNFVLPDLVVAVRQFVCFNISLFQDG